MDPRRVIIRPFSPEDYEAQYEIGVEFAPSVMDSVDELKREDQVMARYADRLNLKLVAETAEDSRVVGMGSLSHSVANYHPQKYWIWVGVRKALRGRGIGSALYSTLEMEARVRGATTLWLTVKEQDARERGIAEDRGFVPQRTLWLSKLDLRTANLEDAKGVGSKLEAEGVRFSTLESEGPQDPKVRRAVYSLSQTCSRDTPRVGEFSPSTFEEFEAVYLDHPAVIPAAFLLAIDRGAYVGMSHLLTDSVQSDTLRIGFTGVLPAYRGRGIAAELKRRAALFARTQGYRFLQTGNDSLNQPILAINQRMGFRPEIVWLTCEKQLDRDL